MFFLHIIEQSAELTSERMVWPSEEILGVEVVGMKLVPLSRRDMVSSGKDVVVKLWILLVDDSLSFSMLTRLLPCCWMSWFMRLAKLV